MRWYVLIFLDAAKQACLDMIMIIQARIIGSATKLLRVNQLRTKNMCVFKCRFSRSYIDCVGLYNSAFVTGFNQVASARGS